MGLRQEHDSELNLTKDSRRQQRKGKGMKRSILHIEQQMCFVEIDYQNASQDFQGNDKEHCTDSPSPAEKIIAGILGVICLILYILVRMVLSYHCGRCPPEFLIYSNNCYHISTEGKTWNESLMACASKSSSLLYIDNEEEMNFLNIFKIHPWVGLSQRNTTNSWGWTIGTTLSSEL
ncbi:NKG2-A/NKG2-B type II integral membrane protein-like [Phyllostomus discolor]|uniref:NKG2-A/NKG2-B type II integral membrane protein-like n=1 Tax=Phyllostomus discolor TaxID=89673 RepID=A0A7E6D0I1_9CHIR|nr:NKG2-A/NKG2-B type II integral membrane protein-like [Phyllostomus discolor]